MPKKVVDWQVLVGAHLYITFEDCIDPPYLIWRSTRLRQALGKAKLHQILYSSLVGMARVVQGEANLHGCKTFRIFGL